LVLADPLLREFARLDFGENLLHLLPGLGGDDARSARVVAVLGGVGDGKAHVPEAALINQIDDQLELMKALEISDLRRIAGLHQRFESRADQFGGATAKYCLLPEEIALRLFAEAGFDHAGAQRAERGGISESILESFAARILLDGD